MKRALLVGVNNYQDPQIQDLGGCVNDVLNIRSVLKELHGFEDEGIHVLTDERATSDNILSRLSKMVSFANPGDILVFHFSGHGSQVRDRNGDELADGLDEIICPHDMNWDYPSTYITDDDIAGVLDGLVDGVQMEVFLDCCHSGTGIRQLQGKPLGLFDANAGKQVWGPPTNRYTPPPIDILCRSMDRPDLSIERLFLANQYLSKPVLWSACKSEQTSADAWIDNGYNGAFTYHLCKTLHSDGPEQRRGAIIQKLRFALARANFDQVPQLETSEEGKLAAGLFE